MRKILTNQNDISAALKRVRLQRIVKPKLSCGFCPNWKEKTCGNCLNKRSVIC